ncbi:hypothetical protein L3049_10630 [Labilibaculum sp. DW002]|uniref:VCBS repeat-containing protein n=1 Tax=Paralabilibaculum antarcticum TaxID=2912572 RepID=A0ABT5VSR6_9BACT|nr:hypothetical protein [Labilibaculum sp. DW002]MDE5418464.1 hypothetical protein [Labilibaculum sp. DW002]
MIKNILLVGIIVCIVCSCHSRVRVSNNRVESDSLHVMADIPTFPSCYEDVIDSLDVISKNGDLIRCVKYNVNNPFQYINKIKGYPELDTIVGDFNGDGTQEKLYCDTVRDLDNELAIVINCSDPSIESLHFDYCSTSMLKNEGDLSGDGKDNLGVLPSGFGACRSYYVFKYEDVKWKLIWHPIPNTLNMRNAGIVLIEKDTSIIGNTIVRFSIEGASKFTSGSNIPDKYFHHTSCSSSDVIEMSIEL